MKAILIIFIGTLIQSDDARLTEDVGQECQSDFECLPSTNCQYYQEQQVLLKSLTDRTARMNMIQDLRKQICNKKERGFCCPKTENESDELEFEDCGMSQNPAVGLYVCRYLLT